MSKLATYRIQGANIEVHAEQDPDWSWLEEQDEKNKVESGEYYQVYVLVTVFDKSGHVEGSNSLGGILCQCSEDLESQVMDIVKEYAMIDEAKYDLNKNIKAVLAANSAPSGPSNS